MAPLLLERDRELAVLDALLSEIAEGQGQIAIVSGEAGIGKTSLVERFLARARVGHHPSLCILWGACEALFTPRPLGPLYDIAQQTQTHLRALLEGDAPRATLFAAVLDELIQASAILVIEDIHWADEATLDLIKYLARRIHRTATLLVLTYRDDELSRDHPLRFVLGDLPARDVTRLRLLPLSEVAVAVLASQGKSSRSATQLYAATGGNPFFLTETLASEASRVPTSVSDAVLARVARYSPEAHRLLEVVAIAPNRIARGVVEALSAGDERALEECLAAGLLQLEDEAVAFRHELARQAVESTLSPVRRQTLHAQVLYALLERGVESASLARLVHHAAQAEDAALVLRFAPAAAKQASSRGAHREAVAHYQTALRYAHNLDLEQRADLLDVLSHELYLTGRHKDAMQPSEEALMLWRALDRTERIGHNLRRLSRLSWFLGDVPGAERCGLAAVEALETLPPGRELAMAYGNMSHLRMLESNNNETLFWGGRAIELAERLDDTETLSYALNNVGSALLDDSGDKGWDKLERSLQIALEHGYEEHVSRAYANLAAYKIGRRDYAQAEGYLRDGIAYCSERDLGAWGHCLRGHQAHARLDQGDWSGAEEDATAILSVPWASGTNRGPALTVLSYVRLRRGDPGVEVLLDEERDLALATGAVDRIAPMAAARAEWRWLQGHREQCVSEAEVGFQLALQHNDRWDVGELAIWLWRSGVQREVPVCIPAPYALQMAGDWRAAANAWKRIGCPYAQALALLDGDEAAQREALAIFERLGAAPAAEITRKKLRAAGARGLPRGPRLATQANPLGLTPRQLEVLVLLAEGLHNSEIADRLATSPRTVDHHVSAILMKLDVRSRVEVAHTAHQLGLVPLNTAR